jgi:uncharacterized protein (TIGR04255 family)
MSSKKLKKSPLVEVVLELRFEQNWGNYDYSIELANLIASLKEHYPNIKPQPAAQLPARFPEPLVRHRFLSKDGKHLVNLGEFLISINTLDYDVIDTFLKEINLVLEKHSANETSKKILRKGLRYINKLEFTKEFNLQNILATKIAYPLYFEKTCVGQSHLFISSFAEGKLNTRITQNPGEEFCFLDLDFFNDQPSDYSIKETLGWVTKSNEHISQAFTTTLNNKYYNSLL